MFGTLIGTIFNTLKLHLKMRLLLILLFSSQSLWAKVSVYLPTSSSLYSSLERLEAFGCSQSTVRLLGPITQSEAFISVEGKEDQNCRAPEWLLIEREIARRPVLPAQAKLRWVTYYDKVPLLNQEASVHSPFSLQGRESFQGSNLYGEMFFGSEGGQEWGFAGAVTPGFVGALDRDQHLHGRFFLHEGYLKVGYRRAELLYGRLQPKLGQTEHGALFLSDDSKPQDMIKLSVRPHTLGSPFKFLGPITFETWVSFLGDALTLTKSKMWVIALGMRPLVSFEFGWIHAIQLGGAGAPSFDLGDAFKVLFYSRDPALQTKRRESTALHFGVWGPSKLAKLYVQLFYNQPGKVSEWLKEDMGILVGLWFPKIGEGEVRLEYVHTPPRLYSHSLWHQGWSLQGTSLGHAVGSDGEALYLDVGLPPMSNWRPYLSFLYESRNRSGAFQLDTEWRYGGGGKIIRRWEKMEILLELKQQSILNFHYTSADNRNTFNVYSELRYLFL